MSDIVDRVARSLYSASPFGKTEGPYEAQTDEYRRLCGVLARAAIGALREPTDDMMNVLGDRSSFAFDEDWRAMIDAALE